MSFTRASLVLPLLLAAAATASARDREIRVRLFYTRAPQAVSIKGAEESKLFVEGQLARDELQIFARNGLVHFKGGYKMFPRRRLTVKSFGEGFWLSAPGLPRRLYRGALEISAAKDRLKLINSEPLETYLQSVVSAEVMDIAHLEAYKAQAVAARTYTLKHIGNHSKEGYNLCDSTHCQLFTGFGSVSRTAREAVYATRDELLAYDGELISAFYHSICGGRTESVIFVWPSEHKPYLISVKDGPESRPYCSIAPAFRWKTRISGKAISRAMREQGWLHKGENLRSLTVLERGASRRAAILGVKADTGREFNISATDFYHGIGRSLGWNAVRSTFFELYSSKGYTVLEGKGYGHGVGLCQWGAEGMARKGFDYREILRHYYPGTKVKYD